VFSGTSSDSACPRLFVTQTPYTPQTFTVNKVRLSQRIRETYLQGPKQPFSLTDEPQQADIVIFWEEFQASEQTLSPKIRTAAAALENPNKVFVVSIEDRPAGFLPGVYCSTPLVGWDEHRFRTGAYFHVMNPLIRDAAENRDRKPGMLYAFVGAATATVRREIFKSLKTDQYCFVQETGNLQFTTNVNDPAKEPGQKIYLEKMLDSAFILCPRGCGHSSYRLFESMQLGRVPVILSDDWIPPRGPCWQDFSVRIAERHVDRIGEILTQFLPQAQEMGKLARAEWESWFRPEVLPFRTFQWIYDIYLSRAHSEADYVKGWPLLAWQSKLPPPLPLRARNKLRRMLGKKVD
jgi:hypothetical protein